MRNIDLKADDVGDVLTADAFNANLRNELQNAVESADITLDPAIGPDTDVNMLGKTLAGYVNAASQYADSGVADAYVLSISTNLKSASKYYDGMKVTYEPGNTNTGASTINVATLGVKSITWPDGTALGAAEILSGTFITLVYNLSDDRFEIASPILFAGGVLGIGTAAPTATGLEVLDKGGIQLIVKETGDAVTRLDFDSNRSSANATLTSIFSSWNGSIVSAIDFSGGDDSINKDEGWLRFRISEGGVVSEAMRIAQDGKVGIGETNPVATLHISGSAQSGLFYRETATPAQDVITINSDVGGTNSVTCVIEANGDLSNTNNSYGAISDASLKENIVDATPKLEDFMSVKIRNFNFKNLPEFKQIGVIAQELEEVFPRLISEKEDGGLKSVKYSVFVPMIIKSIQELVTLNGLKTA